VPNFECFELSPVIAPSFPFACASAKMTTNVTAKAILEAHDLLPLKERAIDTDLGFSKVVYFAICPKCNEETGKPTPSKSSYVNHASHLKSCIGVVAVEDRTRKYLEQKAKAAPAGGSGLSTFFFNAAGVANPQELSIFKWIKAVQQH